MVQVESISRPRCRLDSHLIAGRRGPRIRRDPARTQPRESPVPCSGCRKPTWTFHVRCNGCQPVPVGAAANQGRHPRHGRFDRLGTQHDRRSLPCLCGSVALIGGDHSVRAGTLSAQISGNRSGRRRSRPCTQLSVHWRIDRGAHWLLTHPLPSPHLRLQLEQAQRHANILRELIEARREGPAQA
jgi:hypothetical protein